MENKLLLKYLIHFLGQVASNSEANRMTPANLAIVFGPNLIKAEVETIETSLNAAKINQVVEDVIKYVDEILS